ncbi:NAD-dependent epimerase/dehydratase family protein [Streptomyces sp. NBC_01142]|uniref:NAD-dependent epimerase/dehydratase family protein n=1 Tax=Streptomyces sp. NBC_01142 TaxID=2975865 RepID=UPI0022526823|nr:NAD-dependent epimerase/dehydratase family protein [Streptomyces sp. NBC_01142]MCX4821401.1 NAD-dependent epimerase/dehydratase family protein [Streptomyces sp. NBC_01142]
MLDVCVIGGNRYFGKRLIARLLKSGNRVTVINRGSSASPAGVTSLVADRDDEESLRAALGSRTFDVVIDQVCYTPRQADIARRVFAGRVRRHVMTSTVEVYEYEHSTAPVREGAVDPRTVKVDLAAPWDDPDFRQQHYGEGKRQAEAVLAQDPGCPYVSVRVAHVLGGADDFTGRVDHYAARIRAGEPIAVPAENHPATYVYVEEIADFLAWTAGQEFTGPVNANAYGPLTTADICAVIEREVGGKAEFQSVEVGETSPFSFTRSYGMDNSRAAHLGYTFRDSSQWLSTAIAETLRSGKEDR